MVKSAPKAKPAMETLVDSFSDLIDEAKERMSDKEFRQAEKKFDQIIDRVRGFHRAAMFKPLR